MFLDPGGRVVLAVSVFAVTRITLKSVRLLIVKLGAIGDIVHTLPTLAFIRDAFPDAEISWVAERRSAEILRGNKLIDTLIEVDTRALRGGKPAEKRLTGATRQVKELRQHDFDLAIDFQGLLKSGMIAKLSGAKKRWGFSRESLREPSSRVFYTNTVRIPQATHVIRRNLDLAAAALEIEHPTSDIVFPVFTDEIHKREADELTTGLGGGDFAILNPAGGWVTKLWPAEQYARLADLIWNEYRMPSIAVTGPDESLLASAVVGGSLSGRTIAAEPSLKGFYELARRANIYVGGDTGPTHLAIAAGAPIVGIFGPTEWWRNGSVNADDICIERSDIDCRVDCHRRTCTKWICMDITPETVFEAVRARLAKTDAITMPV